MSHTFLANDLEQLCYRVLISIGSQNDQAEIVAKNLVWNDLIGRHSQGVWRLSILAKRLAQQLINPNPVIKFEQQSASLLKCDGDNSFGQYVGHKAMMKAIEIAGQQGLAMVAIRHSNYFGSGAYYVNLATKQNMLAIAMSNSFPKVRAFGGDQSVLGTNPLAFGAPRENSHDLLVDMATSSQAGSTVRKAKEKGCNQADTPLEPLGGAKGYALALMVEIFSGIITGSGFSHQVKSMYDCFEDKGNNGHFFLTLNIKHLMPIRSYYCRLEELISLLKTSSSNPNSQILVPGEIRWKNFLENKKNGISLDDDDVVTLKRCLEEYGVTLDSNI